MKKTVFFTILLLAFLAFFHNENARARGKDFYRTYEVAEITDDGIVLQDLDGDRFQVNKDPEGYKVGDYVRYDSVRDILRMSPWQPAKVIKMTDRDVTLLLNNGDEITVSMKSSYRNKFIEGDAVEYKAATQQIKKSKSR